MNKLFHFLIIIKLILLVPIFSYYISNYDIYSLSRFSVVNFPTSMNKGRWYSDYPIVYPIVYAGMASLFHNIRHYAVVFALCLTINAAFYLIFFKLFKVRKDWKNLLLFLLLFGLVYKDSLLDFRLLMKPVADLLALVSFYYFKRKEPLKGAIFISFATLTRQYYILFALIYFIKMLIDKRTKEVLVFSISFFVLFGGITMIAEIDFPGYIYYIFLYASKIRLFHFISNPAFWIILIATALAFIESWKDDLNFLLFAFMLFSFGIRGYIGAVVVFLPLLFENLSKNNSWIINIVLIILIIETAVDVINLGDTIKGLKMERKYNKDILELLPYIDSPVISEVPALMSYDVPVMEEFIGDTEVIDGRIIIGDLPKDYLVELVKEKQPEFILLKHINLWEDHPDFRAYLNSNYSNVSVPFFTEYRPKYISVYSKGNTTYGIFTSERWKEYMEDYRDYERTIKVASPVSIKALMYH